MEKINIMEESQKMILETFNYYKEGKKLPRILRGRTIIHLYPIQDTLDEFGELHGYEDSLFFRFDIYNSFNQKMYHEKGLYDELLIEVPTRIRYFKDLSTMIVIDKDICIGGVQSILIYPAQKA